MSEMEQLLYDVGKIGRVTLESYGMLISGETCLWRCAVRVDTHQPGAFEIEITAKTPMDALRQVHKHIQLAVSEQHP